MGHSDWKSDTITVYVSDSAIEDTLQKTRLEAALSDHVSVLLKHVFLSCKPARPAQSRWTGVASVANFVMSLSLCHNLMKPLFSSLAAKDKDGDADKSGMSIDADAGSPSSEIYFRIQNRNMLSAGH